ncbi:BON domain-containing protein [Dokdonella immobilis]|uniref:Osmotically-inducible protein OsmY, contains BON domain n=1 Tax=Dokdonella immobilis TaxID=578942 RepID=A0A1I4ZA73_9GAMM|nr:BON domain-containing protein [Dokdonella immobilis]SFN47202.1 Osmotically-inducible protein OsmY, contains BON domain [Dokdonella immobilis]
MNDKELRQLVLDELEYEPSLDAADIGVTAENGVVTLSGYVTDYSQKVAAERAAWRVRGVRAIAQKIEVRLAGDKRQHDDEIAQRILSIFAWNTLIPENKIRAKVSDGWVTLSGHVDWHYQRGAAESEVRKLSGVKGVTNEIQLTVAAQQGDVKRRIEDALRRYAEIEASDIRVDIKDGSTVHLEGRVDNWGERSAVERAVWSAPGVRNLVDNLVIR